MWPVSKAGPGQAAARSQCAVPCNLACTAVVHHTPWHATVCSPIAPSGAQSSVRCACTHQRHFAARGDGPPGLLVQQGSAPSMLPPRQHVPHARRLVMQL